MVECFENILSNRIGIGNYQVTQFLYLGLLDFIKGVGEVFMPILIRIVATEWSINVVQQASLGMIFFGGNALGSLISSLWADKHGRRFSILLALFCLLQFTIGQSLANSFWSLALWMSCCSIAYGALIPLNFIILSEITPLKVRGIFLVSLPIFYLLGVYYMVGLCYIYLDNYHEGNWKGLLQSSCIIMVVTFIIANFNLRESARFLLFQSQYTKCFIKLNKMGVTNNNEFLELSDEEVQEYNSIQKNNLIQWKNEVFIKKRSVVFKDLFRSGVRVRTLMLWALFGCCNVISCGNLIVFPYLLSQSDRTFLDMVYSYLMDIPAILVVILLIENAHYGGRINTLIYGLLVIIGAQIGLIWFESEFLVIGMMMTRFGTRIIWCCLNALPNESYTTFLRSLGSGAAQSVGKLLGAASSCIYLPLYYFMPYSPFYFGIVLCLTCIAILLAYPVNATQLPID